MLIAIFAFENLSKIYLEKYFKAMNEKQIVRAQKHRTRAINYLKNALTIVKKFFPRDSIHITRIQSKLSCVIHRHSFNLEKKCSQIMMLKKNIFKSKIINKK